MFVVAGVFSLSAAATVAAAPERPRLPHARSQGGFWASLVEPRVALPSVLLVLIHLVYPIVSVLVVLYARARGIDALGWYFFASGLAMIGAQYLSRLSDRWGRKPLAAASFVLSGLGLAIMLFADAALPLIIGGMLGAAGAGLAQAALIALALDLADPARRGAALATCTAAQCSLSSPGSSACPSFPGLRHSSGSGSPSLF